MPNWVEFNDLGGDKVAFALEAIVRVEPRNPTTTRIYVGGNAVVVSLPYAEVMKTLGA
jgi:hypothetical protein